MRTNAKLAITLSALMLVCLIPASNAGSAPVNGSAYDVTTDETWNTGSELNAVVTVQAGATLTISADYTLPAGASITVAEGGTLRVEEGSLTSGAFSQAVRMVPNGASSLMAFSGDASGGFSLKIVAASGTNMSGWAVSGENIPAQDLAGSEHVINFTAPREDFRINFSLNPGSFTDLVIDHLEIDDGTTVTTTPAYLAEPMNCFMADELGTLFPLNIAGTAHFDNSSIVGADVMITGAVTSMDSHFTASGPINVEGQGSSLSSQGGSMTMSSADHDVNLDGEASLTWDGTTGTGGVVDRWERNIGQQEIHIPIGSECTGGYCVEYKIHNHGPSEGTMIRNSVEGVALVPGRTVEIGWADGTIWTENASVEVTNFRTAWNLGSTMSSWSEGKIVPLPWDVEIFEILPHLDHPVISVDSVNIESTTGQVGRSIDVDVTVTNSGQDQAAIYIRCNVAGTDNYADMTPTYSAMLLDAGETETLNANWTYHKAEDAGLDCYVEEPFQFIDASPFITQGSASSTRDGAEATVSWSSVDEDSSAAIIMLVAIVLTVIVGLVVAVRLASDASSAVREIRHQVDDEERVDRFAEMMDEEDES